MGVTRAKDIFEYTIAYFGVFTLIAHQQGNVEYAEKCCNNKPICYLEENA